MRSRIHGHHQILCLLPWVRADCCIIAVCRSLSVFSNWKASSVGLRSSDWFSHWTISLPWETLGTLLQDALSHYSFYCEALSNQVCSIVLNLNSIATEFTRLLLGAVILSINTNDPTVFDVVNIPFFHHTFLFPMFWYKLILFLSDQRLFLATDRPLLDAFWQSLSWLSCPWV